MIEHRVTVKITEDIYNKLEDLSKKLGETRSGVMRQAVISFLKEWGSL